MLPTSINIGVQIVGVNLENSDGRGLADFPKALLAGPQTFLHTFAFSDVHSQSGRFHNFSALVLDRRYNDLQPNRMRIFMVYFKMEG